MADQWDRHSKLGVWVTSELTISRQSRLEGRFDPGFQVFDRMTNRNVVSWTALILGYARGGDGETALQLFQVVKNSGIAPNALITYSSVLRACGSVAAVDIGRAIIRKAGLELEPAFSSASQVRKHGREWCLTQLR
ncbi:pentatricopeptide repeat-containing protein At2g33680-like [Selaginella moellendorffii]|uniref:pentatricopeptide repeat-containing protein At2g33680-like n=1 Tax=Selaginella moellendorffii TaxID=88036 RepID=UPI000D1CC1FE|nr:pentatricopeptide repeat-containing protein At2g33680-like [Selaginella moellendorffii]|eukprot:XP_024537416.1 pentatricopeptide repeat-containing protein At2g33680-like [Selaginella moellendorffii]